MEKTQIKSSSICLLAASVLLIVTMVLHPTGGNIEHLIEIKGILMGSHGLAIFSLPFVCFGFWGLALVLQTPSHVSMLAFMIACFGLIAGMIAATINGLTLPFFITNFQDKTLDPQTLKAILTYGRYINIPMDYIMIITLSVAIGIWSFLMIQTKKVSKWLGYYGLVILFMGSLGFHFQFNFVDLFGFRVFVFGMASWIIGAGVLLLKME